MEGGTVKEDAVVVGRSILLHNQSIESTRRKPIEESGWRLVSIVRAAPGHMSSCLRGGGSTSARLTYLPLFFRRQAPFAQRGGRPVKKLLP